MTRRLTRHARTLVAVTALALPTVLAGMRVVDAAPAGPPASLVVVGTSDLKGKTSPCGCHIPRGGFARLAALLDSTRAGGPLLFVDAGGAFPDVLERADLADFMFAELGALHVDAVGVAPRDLSYGLAFLRDVVRRHGVPVVCANLVERAGHRPIFPASRVVERDGVKIGIFALLGERFPLGPAADSLAVLEPESAATRVVADLRARGATVIVALTQLGRVGGEDLASAVPGIDAIVLGHDIPVLEKGRRIGATIASYAGEQGQNVGLLRLSLAPGGRVGDATAEARELGPGMREEPQAFTAVKAFEDAYNERMRLEQRRAQALDAADPENDPVDHFVGAAICARCHPAESRQWRTTAHSLAWETLVREKKDATPECIPCHSVGYRQPGGFRDAARTPGLADVQCENCHGMGTQHVAGWLSQRAIDEMTCRGCHNEERDPTFDYAAKLPLMVHGNTSGESIRIIQARRAQGLGMGGR